MCSYILQSLTHTRVWCWVRAHDEGPPQLQHRNKTAGFPFKWPSWTSSSLFDMLDSLTHLCPPITAGCYSEKPMAARGSGYWIHCTRSAWSQGGQVFWLQTVQIIKEWKKKTCQDPSIPCQAVWNGSTIVAEWTHKIGSIHFLTANDFDPYPVQLTPAFKEWRRAHGPFLSWLIGLEGPCAFETIGRKLLSKRVRRWTQLRWASLSFAEPLLASPRLLWASCVWLSVSASVHAFLEGSTRSRLSASMLQVETFLPGQCVPWMIRISWALFYHISRVWCGTAFSII